MNLAGRIGVCAEFSGGFRGCTRSCVDHMSRPSIKRGVAPADCWAVTEDTHDGPTDTPQPHHQACNAPVRQAGRRGELRERRPGGGARYPEAPALVLPELRPRSRAAHGLERGRYLALARESALPDCEERREAIFGQSELDEFDVALDEGTRSVAADLDLLARANMADDIDRFLKALQADHIVPRTSRRRSFTIFPRLQGRESLPVQTVLSPARTGQVRRQAPERVPAASRCGTGADPTWAGWTTTIGVNPAQDGGPRSADPTWAGWTTTIGVSPAQDGGPPRGRPPARGRPLRAAFDDRPRGDRERLTAPGRPGSAAIAASAAVDDAGERLGTHLVAGAAGDEAVAERGGGRHVEGAQIDGGQFGISGGSDRERPA